MDSAAIALSKASAEALLYMGKDIRNLLGLLLRILAVVADVIAVVSVLSFDSSTASQNSLQIHLTPLFALAIWLISVWTYLGLLQRFWQANQQRRQYNTLFSKFIRQDLMRKFREPFVLLPAAVHEINIAPN